MSENNLTELQAKNLLASGLNVNIYKWASEFIYDAMENWIGISCYACEIGYDITGEEKRKGFYDPIKFIMEHFKEAGEELRYQKEELCSEINPFEDPDAFVECWLEHSVEAVLSGIPFIIDNWNNIIEITEDMVNEIKKYLI